MGYITKTYTLTNGTTADATQPEQNFTDILTGLSDGTKDVNLSSVTAVTVTASGDITCDDLTAAGNVKAALLSMCGSKTPGWINNIGLTISAGVLTIRAADGSALSASNYGYVAAPGVDAGEVVSLKVTSGGSLIDDTGASDLTNVGFGITETADWAEDVPFFIYVVNRADSVIDGSDGNSCFAIARNPAMITTPSSANNIGNTSAGPVTDDQTSIILLGSYTVANYTSKPAQIIGGFRMQWSTTTDDWTFQALSNADGIGHTQLKKFFSGYWTFPGGQNGGNGTGHMKAASAPTFTSETFLYKIGPDGMVDCFVNFSGDTATDGSTGTTAECALPYSVNGFSTVTVCFALCYLTYAGTVSLGLAECRQSSTSMDFFNSAGTTLTNGDFSNGSRVIDTTIRYKAF